MKSNYTILTTLWIISLFFFNHTLVAQNSWATLMSGAEKAYQSGSYNIAISKARNVKKKNGRLPQTDAWVAILQARAYAAKGDYDEMEKKLSKGFDKLEKLKKEDFASYTIGMYQVVTNYLEYGNAVKAQEILNQLQEEITTQNFEDPSIFLEIDYRQSQIYFLQGHLQEADTLLNQIIPIWEAQMNAGSKEEIRYKQQQYAEMITLKGQIITGRGDYETAKGYFEEQHKPIKKLVKAKSYHFGKFMTARAYNMYMAEDFKEANKYYGQALKTTKANIFFQKSFKKSSKDYLELYAQSTRNLMYTSIPKKNKKVKENIEFWDKLMYAFYFGKTVYRFQGDLVEAEFDWKQGKRKRAERKLSATLEDAKEVLPTDHPMTLQVAQKLYEFHIYKNADLDGAENNLLTSTAITQSLLGDTALHNRFEQLKYAVFLLEHTDDVSQGRQIMYDAPQNAIMRQWTENHREYITLLDYLVKYYDLIEEYDIALENAQRALELSEYKYTNNSAEYGKQLAILSGIQIRKGQYLAAENNMDESLNIIRRKIQRKSVEFADALATTARLYGIMGSYSEAERLLKRSSRINRRLGGDISQNAKAVEELAFLYIRIGEYADTEELLLEAVARKEEKYGPQSKTLVNPLNQLALLYLITGDYTQSEKMGRRASDIANQVYGDSTLIYAESITNLGKLYLTIGSFDKAQDNFDQIVAIRRRELGDKHVLLANSLTDLAFTRFYQKPEENVTEAENLLLEARDIVKENFDVSHPLYATAITNLADLYIQTDRFQEAETYLQQANVIWEAKLGPQNINSATIATLLGDLYTKQGLYDQANENYLKSQNIFLEIFSEEHPSYVRTLTKQGQMFYASGNLEEANRVYNQAMETYLKFLQTYFTALSEGEKSKFWSLMQPDFEFYTLLATKQADTKPELLSLAYKYNIATKGILLNSSIKIRERILNSDDEELKLIYQDWVAQKEFLTAALSMSPEQLKEDGIKVKSLLNNIEKLEKELSEKSGDFAKEFETVYYTWEDVQKGLEPDEVAVELVRYREFADGFTDEIRYAAFIITPYTEKNPQVVVLENGKDLESRYLNYYRYAVRTIKTDKLSYENFWKPIKDAIIDYDKVYLSPDKVYNQINLSSMLIAEDEYVIDRTNIHLIGNTKQLAINYLEQQGKLEGTTDDYVDNTAIICANPQFYATLGLEPTIDEMKDLQRGGSFVTMLPGTAIEGQQVNSLLQDNKWKTYFYSEGLATEEQLSDIASPRVFHIATHGFFDANPLEALGSSSLNALLRSGLMLVGAGEILAEDNTGFNSASGILTAAEVMNMSFDNTELVVLSACETALGEVKVGEGVYGLQRAFLVAGADALIMSLFKVSDEVTVMLMTEFYKNWLVLGDKREAFSLAQKIVKSQYPEPKYWGSFVLIGNK